MDNKKKIKPLSSLLQNPSEILEIAKNPGKYGLDTFRSLSNQQKQYVAFAAAAGLVIYGFMVNRK
ncbi:hypothetical protein [Pontibacter beigongshangensis]|uniref:hypothetical protein n=1 Tax=Pontibacter beigongshangensis TaxID=2574733 RepID=UPI00164FB429|nr:hypothetical protein [Pontibacter beigongshangensis]